MDVGNYSLLDLCKMYVRYVCTLNEMGRKIFGVKGGERRMRENIKEYGDIEKLILIITKYHGDWLKAGRLQKYILLSSAVLVGNTNKLKEIYGECFCGLSDDVEESARVLSEEGYLVYVKGKGYKITNDGEKLVSVIEQEYSAKSKTIEIMITYLKNLSDKNLRDTVYFLFPELLNEVSKE